MHSSMIFGTLNASCPMMRALVIATVFAVVVAVVLAEMWQQGMPQNRVLMVSQ